MDQGRADLLFSPAAMVTHARRSAESPSCSPNGNRWAAPAPIGERVSTEGRAMRREGAPAWQRPRSLLPTLGIRSEADHHSFSDPSPGSRREHLLHPLLHGYSGLTDAKAPIPCRVLGSRLSKF